MAKILIECPVCNNYAEITDQGKDSHLGNITYCQDENSSWLDVSMMLLNFEVAHRCSTEEARTIELH